MMSAFASMAIKYFGHAAFQLKSQYCNMLIDPFLSANPLNKDKEIVETIEADFIVVTHGHHDHLGDAVEISRRTGATIISSSEVINYCMEQGATNVHSMHIGGQHDFPFGSVKLTFAAHSAGIPGGHAAGAVIDWFGCKIYHAGDTGLFGDMIFLREQKIDWALLPIGDNFTMGIEDAIKAIKLILPQTVVPMHYNTFPPIVQDVTVFLQKVNELAHGIKVKVLQPNDTSELAK